MEFGLFARAQRERFVKLRNCASDSGGTHHKSTLPCAAPESGGARWILMGLLEAGARVGARKVDFGICCVSGQLARHRRILKHRAGFSLPRRWGGGALGARKLEFGSSATVGTWAVPPWNSVDEGRRRSGACFGMLRSKGDVAHDVTFMNSRSWILELGSWILDLGIWISELVRFQGRIARSPPPPPRRQPTGSWIPNFADIKFP